MGSFGPPCLFNEYLSASEASCYFPDEGIKKSSRNHVYEIWYFWNRDVVEIGMEVVRVMFRLDYLLPSSGNLQVAAPENANCQIANSDQSPHIVCILRRTDRQ